MKKFQGNYCILFILFCIGIVPGIIYLAMKYQEVPENYTGFDIGNRQNTVVNIQLNGEKEKTGRKCEYCGAIITGTYCSNCGNK